MMPEREWMENYREFFEGLDDEYIRWLEGVIERERKEGEG